MMLKCLCVCVYWKGFVLKSTAHTANLAVTYQWKVKQVAKKLYNNERIDENEVNRKRKAIEIYCWVKPVLKTVLE